MSVTVSKDKEAQLVGSAEEKSKERMPLEASENPESAKTKKSKKKKKKKAKDASSDQDGRNTSGTQTPEQGTSSSGGGVKGKTIIPTSDECFICGTARDRSVSEGINVVPPEDYDIPGMTRTPLWACPKCRKGLEETSRSASYSLKKGVGDTIHTLFQPATSYINSQVEDCSCKVCVEKREGSKTERELHTTQTYWMELRNVVRCIYRDPLVLLNGSVTRTAIGSPEMSAIVQKLCASDPHQFFQRLETLTREYLLEVKVRLLEQLSLGYNSVPLAIKFIQMLVNEYSILCKALPLLLLLLQPLNDESYATKLGVTVELMNKNIFRELIFAEAFMSSNLPLITAQLKLASLATDPSNKRAADMLNQRYSALDQEMTEIGKMWTSAKGDLKVYVKEQEKRAQELKEDMERFKEWRKSGKKQVLNNTHRHLYQLVKNGARFLKDPIVKNIGSSEVCQTFTLQVDVKRCVLLEQSLSSAPKFSNSVDGVRGTVLYIVRDYGMNISPGQVVLEWVKTPPPGSRSPSPSRHNGDEVLVQPVEESRQDQKSDLLIPLSSLVFVVTFSGPVTEEEKKHAKEKILSHADNIEVYVKLAEVYVGTDKYVNISENPEYCLKKKKATQTPVELENMVYFWQSIHELWKRETMPPQSPKEVVPCEPTDNSGILLDGDGEEVRPLYEFSASFSTASSPPCECSACISSLAARYTQDHFRLLDPTDPFGNQLQLLDTDTGTSQEARTISGDTLPKFNNTPDVKGPLTCVHVANMGNSKTKNNQPDPSTQAITATRYDTHTTIDIHAPGTLFVSGLIKPPHHMMGGHNHKSDSGMETEPMDSSLDNHHCDNCSDSTTHQHSHTHSHSHSHTCSGKANGSETGAVSKETNGVNGSSSGEVSGQKRYCRCCYCELFGPNGPPPLQTSHNYRYYRDRMRQKLERKKDTKSDGSGSTLDMSRGGSDQPSVEKLLEFIEGPQETEPKVSARAAKRQRRKKKKTTKPEGASSGGQTHSKDAHDEGEEDDEKMTNSGNPSDEDANVSDSDGEEVVEVRIPTQPQYHLDPIKDDEIPISQPHDVEEPVKMAPVRKTASPVANGSEKGSGNKEERPRQVTSKPTANIIHHTVSPTQQHQQKPTSAASSSGPQKTTSVHTKSEPKQMPMANGHIKSHPQTQTGTKRTDSQTQPKRFVGNSSGGENYRYSNQHQQPVRTRQTSSYLPPNLPPRLQRQVQEQMQSSHHQGQNRGKQGRHGYQQRGGQSYRHQGYTPGSTAVAGTPPDDVFLPKDLSEDSDKEIEEFKR